MENGLGLSGQRQLDLSLFSRLTNALDGHPVPAEVNARLLEFVEDVVEQGDVKVFTAECLRWSIYLQRLPFASPEQRSQRLRINRHGRGHICQGSSGGFVDDTEDLEASNLTSILCGLSLSIVEVSGDGNDCVAKTSNLVYTRITYELLPFIADVDLDSWTAISLFDNLKGPKTM